MANENPSVGDEEGGGSLNPELHEQQVTNKARDKGWAPLEQWRGDPEDWVDAKEFLGRQKLYDKIGDLKSQIHQNERKTREDFGTISKHFAAMRETEYKRALKDLQVQKAMAIEDKNIEAVAIIDKDIKQVEEDQRKLKEDQLRQEQQTQKANSGESPAFTKWKQEHQWFEKDTEMRDDAISIGIGYSAAHPGAPEGDVYKYVTTRIQKMYPERFPTDEEQEDLDSNEEEKPVRKKLPSVEGGGLNGRQAAVKKKGKLSVADLSDDERTVMRTLIRRDALKEVAAKNKRSQEEEYLAQIAVAKGL